MSAGLLHAMTRPPRSASLYNCSYYNYSYTRFTSVARSARHRVHPGVETQATCAALRIAVRPSIMPAAPAALVTVRESHEVITSGLQLQGSTGRGRSAMLDSAEDHRKEAEALTSE